jgi:glycosyltransferase involved in cell wall biosynthesis
VTVLSGPPYPQLEPGIPLVRLPSLDYYAAVPPGRGALRRVRRPVDALEYAAASLGVFPEPLTFGMRAYRYLRARRSEFDVVHDNQSLSYPLLALSRLGLPVVATIHHPIHIDRACALRAAGSTRERLDIGRWHAFVHMQGHVARRLPRIVAVSAASRRDAARAFRLDLDRVRVVHNGVDAERFVAREGLRRDPDRVVVVTSADQPVKGLQLLYGVLERVVARRPVEVQVVGSPRDPRAAERELVQRGLVGRVRFLGKLEGDELVDAYAGASVAVVPSLYEGFGFPAAEALACGVPVVAFAAGALPEVLGEDGECARLVAPYDVDAMAGAVIDLLGDPQRALRMGLAGRSRVLERFDWRRAAEETAAVYEEALAC